MIDKPMEIGDIEIFDEFYDVGGVKGKWIPFQLDIAFIHIIKLRIVPKGRIWNGSQWVRAGIKGHIMALIHLMEESE